MKLDVAVSDRFQHVDSLARNLQLLGTLLLVDRGLTFDSIINVEMSSP